jgi:hypothetical protein
VRQGGVDLAGMGLAAAERPRSRLICVAQSAGDPSTGAHGQGNLSADIPAQPTAGDMADFVSSVYPTGRGARAAEKIAAKAGWFERAVTWVKGLFAAESAAARTAPAWKLGGFKSAEKWASQMSKRGWTPSKLLRLFRKANASPQRIS